MEEICANRNVLIVKITAIWYDYRQLFMKIYRKTSLKHTAYVEHCKDKRRTL